MAFDPRVNEAKKLKYLDPRAVLTVPGALEAALADFEKSRKLSDSERRKVRIETIDGAVFALGMGELWKRSTEYAVQEAGSHDSVLKVSDSSGGVLIGSVQLKQYGPGSSERGQSLNDFLAALEGKYHDPDDLYLAVSVNTEVEVDPAAIIVPAGLRDQVMELWLFGRTKDDRSRWWFYGDMLDGPRWSFHTIPDVLPLPGEKP